MAFFFSLMNSLNLVLIPGARLDDHLRPWTGCIFIDHFKRKYVNPISHNLWLIYERYIDDIVFSEQLKSTYLNIWKNSMQNINQSNSTTNILNLVFHSLTLKFTSITTNYILRSAVRKLTVKTAFTLILNIKKHLRKVYHTAKPSGLKGFALIQSNTSNTAKYSRKLSRKGM